jgi:hypothetical protein
LYGTPVIIQNFPLEVLSSSIYGTLYIDDDYSLALSNDDVLLPGVEVQLFDEFSMLIATGLTNASGAYSFPGLLSGNYTLQYITPNGLIPEVVNVGTIDALTN